MQPRCILYLLVVTLWFFPNCYAQASQSVPESQGMIGFSKQFVRDEANLWTSPLRVKRQDLRWIVLLGIGEAALLRTDRNISGEIEEAKSIQPLSHIVSQAGSFPLYATSASLLVLGHLTKDDRTTRAGSVALQALLHSAIIVQTLKASTNRERPDKIRGDGGFWDGGKSFPSGHAMSSWAFAAAMSDQYPDKKWIRIGGYAMATAVGISRISGRNHFPSDVLIGSSLGWLIGHYVSRHHQ
jgi:membrane-associated phospholipid phosphatase